MNPPESLGENSSLGAVCLSFWQQVQYEDKFLFLIRQVCTSDELFTEVRAIVDAAKW